MPQKQKQDNRKIEYFMMGHAEMAKGWTFSEPSWGVRLIENGNETVKGIFMGSDDSEARKHAEKLAKEYNCQASRVTPF